MTLYIILLTIAASLAGFSNERFRNLMIFNPWLVNNKKQWYRFVSCGLIHGDFLHLLVNMFVLYSFGQAVEEYYHFSFGHNAGLMYIGLYVSAIFAANASTYARHKNDPSYNSLGASGGVSAVLFASILFNPMGKVYLYGLLGLPGIVMGVAYIAYSYYMDKKQQDNVNHDAHLWGAVYGVAYTMVMKPSVIQIFWFRLTEGF